MKTPKPQLFLDFDGTISRVDVIDALLEKFADPQWLQFEKQWMDGEIGSRACLESQFACLRASHAEVYEFIDSLEIDDGFISVLQVCRESLIPVTIVSDGFEEYIRRMLRPYAKTSPLVSEVRIFANSLIEFRTNEWRTVYPYFGEICSDGCATCKPEVMMRQNAHNAPMIFVGDGLSDRFAARAAHTVFAKSKLSKYCSDKSISHIPFPDLAEVSYSLAQMVSPKGEAPLFPSVMCSEAV